MYRSSFADWRLVKHRRLLRFFHSRTVWAFHTLWNKTLDGSWWFETSGVASTHMYCLKYFNRTQDLTRCSRGAADGWKEAGLRRLVENWTPHLSVRSLDKLNADSSHVDHEGARGGFFYQTLSRQILFQGFWCGGRTNLTWLKVVIPQCRNQMSFWTRSRYSALETSTSP